MQVSLYYHTVMLQISLLIPFRNSTKQQVYLVARVHILKNCYECCRYIQYSSKDEVGLQVQHETINAKCCICYKTPLQELYLLHDTIIHCFWCFAQEDMNYYSLNSLLTLLCLYYLMICYYMFILNLSRKCVLKNIFIITFASHSMQANCTQMAEKPFTDLFKCIEQNGVVRMLVKYHIYIVYCALLNVLWLLLKVCLFTSFTLLTAL